MIIDRVKGEVFSQKVLYETELFGKTYFWMKDVDGTIYLVKSKNGKPSFL